MKLKSIVILLLLCFTSYTVNAQTSADEKNPPADYVETLQKMLIVSNSLASMDNLLSRMIDMYEEQMPNVPKEYWEMMEKEYEMSTKADFVKMIAPIYYKYLTKDDLNKAIKFYDTPVGKKMAYASPFMSADLFEIGQKWAVEINTRIKLKLIQNKYLDKM